MSISLIVNSQTYSYPQTGDSKWGPAGTGWAQAVTVGMLQKAGGSFTLTAEVDFGATYGAKIAYLKTETSNISLTGWARLANTTDSISWRNAANSADLALTVNSSNILSFNGEVIPAGLIVNADVDPAAAIAFSKMAALTASRIVVTDGSGVVAVGAATSTEAGYLSGVTSAIQTQLDAKVSKAGDTMTGYLVLNADPASALQAATKQYVDSLATGINAKTACRVATTTSGTLASSFENGDTIDGVVLATNDRILIKNQVAQAENGIYTVNASGAPTRSTDADTWAELVGAFVFITAGTANAATQWVCNVAAGGTLGVTAVTFVQFGAQITYSASGQGITLSGTTFSLQLDGGTLSQSGSGAKVADGGVANTQIANAAGISVNKLAALTSSRAVASDGSGFLVSATTTATELGYVNGVTSAIQTQLDAKIAASVMTTNGDLITRAAGVPARIAIGTSGYYLGSNGSAASWTDPKISFTDCQVSGGPTSVPTAFAAMVIGVASGNSFNPVTITAGTSFTFPYTGTYSIKVNLGLVDGTSGRTLMFRLRNTTDSTTTATTVAGGVSSNPVEQSFILTASPSTGKNYELQWCASGSGVTVNSVTINGVASKGYITTIERIRQ